MKAGEAQTASVDSSLKKFASHLMLPESGSEAKKARGGDREQHQQVT